MFFHKEYIKKPEASASRKGVILIAALFLSMILLILGMALLSIRSSQAKTLSLSGFSLQARHLAEFGMEDAKIKIRKCVDFPNQIEGQDFYTYREEVNDFDGCTIGVYTVTINMKNKYSGKYLQVSSTGISGTIIKNPSTEEKRELIKLGRSSEMLKARATRTITAIMPLEGSNAYTYINYRDGGSY